MEVLDRKKRTAKNWIKPKSKGKGEAERDVAGAEYREIPFGAQEQTYLNTDKKKRGSLGLKGRQHHRMVKKRRGREKRFKRETRPASKNMNRDRHIHHSNRGECKKKTAASCGGRNLWRENDTHEKNGHAGKDLGLPGLARIWGGV